MVSIYSNVAVWSKIAASNVIVQGMCVMMMMMMMSLQLMGGLREMCVILMTAELKISLSKGASGRCDVFCILCAQFGKKNDT